VDHDGGHQYWCHNGIRLTRQCPAQGRWCGYPQYRIGSLSSLPSLCKAKLTYPTRGRPRRKRMDVDNEKSSPFQAHTSLMLSDSPVSVELSQAFKYAMQLAFPMVSFMLRNPMHKASPFCRVYPKSLSHHPPHVPCTVSKHPEHSRSWSSSFCGRI
jgi:hypothetical protein